MRTIQAMGVTATVEAIQYDFDKAWRLLHLYDNAGKHITTTKLVWTGLPEDQDGVWMTGAPRSDFGTAMQWVIDEILDVLNTETAEEMEVGVY